MTTHRNHTTIQEPFSTTTSPRPTHNPRARRGDVLDGANKALVILVAVCLSLFVMELMRVKCLALRAEMMRRGGGGESGSGRAGPSGRRRTLERPTYQEVCVTEPEYLGDEAKFDRIKPLALRAFRRSKSPAANVNCVHRGVRRLTDEDQCFPIQPRSSDHVSGFPDINSHQFVKHDVSLHLKSHRPSVSRGVHTGQMSVLVTMPLPKSHLRDGDLEGRLRHCALGVATVSWRKDRGRVD